MIVACKKHQILYKALPQTLMFIDSSVNCIHLRSSFLEKQFENDIGKGKLLQQHHWIFMASLDIHVSTWSWSIIAILQ